MTREEYLIELARLIRENFGPNNICGRLTAARIGYLARLQLKEEPRACGFGSLKEALLELERQGIIRTGDTPKKALAVWLVGAATVGPHPTAPTNEPVAVQRAEPHTSTARFQRLRNPVWLAFVSRAPTGRRFMHKDTGQVMTGQGSAPQPAEKWAEIEPVDEDSDRADASAFIESESLLDKLTLEGVLASPNWFQEFHRLLREQDPFLASKWNRRRSNRVIAEVTQWCLANGIASHLVFETPVQSVSIPTPAPSAGKDQLKPLLLSAIHLMSTKELLSLPIPARYLVARLRPELLSDE